MQMVHSFGYSGPTEAPGPLTDQLHYQMWTTSCEWESKFNHLICFFVFLFYLCGVSSWILRISLDSEKGKTKFVVYYLT